MGALFLHLDKLPCCCCNPMEQLSVYDPEQDGRFIMLDGEIVDDPDDEETVEVSILNFDFLITTCREENCCGWCRQVEVSELGRELRGKPISEEETVLYFDLPSKYV